MEIQTIITTIGAFLGSAVGIALVGVVVRAIISSVTKKFDTKKITKDTISAVKEQIQGLNITQNIQPIVESELVKVNEMARKVATDEIEKLQVKYDKLLACLEKFYQYFDDSLVAQDKKDELRAELDNAKEKEPEKVIESVIVLKEVQDESETETPTQTIQR